MPLTGSAAKRYAEAFLDLAEERRAVDESAAALGRMAEALSGEAFRLLASPEHPIDSRRRALELVTASEPALVRALLFTLLERGRIALLPAIARAHRDLLDARAGVEKAVITTATELDESERRALVERLERASGKTLRATFAADPSLIGGVLLRIGDHQLDGSVRTRLAVMRDRLAAG